MRSGRHAVPREGGSGAGAPARRPVRLVLVEDHQILREGLRSLLEIESDLDVVGEAGNAQAALEKIRALQPDVLLTDLALPNGSGMSLIRTVRDEAPEVRSLVLTGYFEEEYIRAAMDAGALGYVLKDSSREELLRAIRSVADGRQYLCTAVAQAVVSGYLNPQPANQSVQPLSSLTDRECQVLARIAVGQSNKVIARELNLSVKTVEKHRSNMMRKLELRNAAEVALFAVRHGLVPAEAENSAGRSFDP
jgi:DNA-binding NarL/FixJ family response regulator